MKIGLLQFKSGPLAPVRSKKLPNDIKMLRDAARARGHEPRVLRVDKCQLYYTRTIPKLLYAGKPFPKVDVVVPRFSMLENVSLNATIVHQIEMVKIPIIQTYDSLISAKNKLRTLQLLTERGIPVPKTMVVSRFEYLDEAIKKIGSFPIIIKTPFGSLGKGVAIVETKRSLHSSFDMLLTSPDFTSILIQEYVAEAEGKDIRVFIIDGKIVASMERDSQGRDFRSNLALGGKGSIIELTKEEKTISLAAANALGLTIAGVDILRSKTGPVIMEVNCNPGLDGITEVSGLDIPGMIIDFAVRFKNRSN